MTTITFELVPQGALFYPFLDEPCYCAYRKIKRYKAGGRGALVYRLVRFCGCNWPIDDVLVVSMDPSDLVGYDPLSDALESEFQ